MTHPSGPADNPFRAITDHHRAIAAGLPPPLPTGETTPEPGPVAPVPHGSLFDGRTLRAAASLVDGPDLALESGAASSAASETDTNLELSEILGSITERAVYGKSPRGMTLSAVGGAPEVVAPPFHEYATVPSYPTLSGAMRPVAENMARILSALSYGGGSPKAADAAVKNRTVILPWARGDQVVVSLLFDTANEKYGEIGESRPHGYGALMVAMPHGSARQLFDLIHRRPDAVEDFINGAAPGMLAMRNHDGSIQVGPGGIPVRPGFVRRPPFGALVMEIDAGNSLFDGIGKATTRDAQPIITHAIQQHTHFLRYGRDYSDAYLEEWRD